MHLTARKEDPAPTLSIVAHVRRLSKTGTELYIRIDVADIARLASAHGRALELDLGNCCFAGIIKTSGASPWLAPPAGGSNARITATLRGAGFEHGMDRPATLRLLGSRLLPTIVDPSMRANAVVKKSQHPSLGSDLKVDPGEAVRSVREYNADFYKGCRNIQLDREGYDLFRNGLSADLGRLIDQLTFVGDRYGAAQQRFMPHPIRIEAASIATKLIRVLDDWNRIVMRAKPLIEEVPSEASLAFLFSPFDCASLWAVWASKTLHFLQPDAFPILDSKAKKALGLNLGTSSRDYHTFCSQIRRVLLANGASLAAARIEDKAQSPTDVKLLDKILYQLGGE